MNARDTSLSLQVERIIVEIQNYIFIHTPRWSKSVIAAGDDIRYGNYGDLFCWYRQRVILTPPTGDIGGLLLAVRWQLKSNVHTTFHSCY